MRRHSRPGHNAREPVEIRRTKGLFGWLWQLPVVLQLWLRPPGRFSNDNKTTPLPLPLPQYIFRARHDAGMTRPPVVLLSYYLVFRPPVGRQDITSCYNNSCVWLKYPMKCLGANCSLSERKFCEFNFETKTHTLLHIAQNCLSNFSLGLAISAFVLYVKQHVYIQFKWKEKVHTWTEAAKDR